MDNNLTASLPVRLHNHIHEDPFCMIAEFFSFTLLDGWRLWLGNWFKAAFDEEYILKESPAGFLFSIDQLQLLLFACYRLLNENTGREKTVENKSVSERPMHRIRREVIIKHLTVHEIMQPVRVLKNFFSFDNYNEWQVTIALWSEAALGATSITGEQDSGKLLPVMEYLYKISEAAWLLLHANNTDDDTDKKITGFSLVQNIL